MSAVASARRCSCSARSARWCSRSRLLGRTVKWIEDRRENLIAASHSRNEYGKVRLAIDDDQIIQAITVEHVADVGAYPPCPAIMDPLLLPGPYKIPGLGFSTTMVWTNTMGKGAYRGPWMFETTAREMAIDHAARTLGIDPIELRRRNLLAADDLPFTSPSGNVFKDITPLETLEQAIEILGYDEFRTEQAAARADGRLLGLGCCVYVEPSSMGAPTLATEGATVRVEASGKVVAYLGTTSHGQSVETTMAQIVADTLGVAYDDVTVVQGESDSTPYGPGTGGSRTAVVVGGAARQASEAVRAKVVAIAAHSLEAAEEDLEIDDGRVFVRGTPARSLTMGDVASAAYQHAEELPPEVDAGLEATVRFRPESFPTWSNATHLCVVEVDRATCMPRVLRYIVSEDCGPMINPTVVDGQISGGVIQGLGGVLLEDFVYDEDGNPLTATLVDYLLPTATDVPTVEIGHLDTPSTTNPGGFKGMGEGGAIGSHAAVANAVADALAPLGVHVLKTPLGPNDIHRLLDRGRRSMIDDLHGRVALVTGAARGLGHAICAALAACGADVIATDLSDLDDTLAAVTTSGRRAVACEADVREQRSLDRAVQQGVAELGGLDIVVANAGISTWSRFWEMPEDQWQTMIDINLGGVWRTFKATAPLLIEQGRGGSTHRDQLRRRPEVLAWTSPLLRGQARHRRLGRVRRDRARPVRNPCQLGASVGHQHAPRSGPGGRDPPRGEPHVRRVVRFDPPLAHARRA